jgi:hypothetical protein
MSTPPPTTPAPPQKPSPEEKLKQSPVFVSIINELNLNVDQLLKRQKLISKIETILSNRYGAQNKLISYIVQFNSPKAAMNVGDLPSWEAILASVSGGRTDQRSSPQPWRRRLNCREDSGHVPLPLEWN